MECHAVIATDSVTLRFSGADAERRKSFLSSLPPGTVVTETLKRYRPPKTHQQVKAIWGLLIESIKRELDRMGFDLQTLIPTARVTPGIECPREVIMQLLYAVCGDVGDQGERKTLSQMTTIEAARFFDRARDHVASAWGIVVPDPDPQWREKLEPDAPTDVGLGGAERPSGHYDDGEPLYWCTQCNEGFDMAATRKINGRQCKNSDLNRKAQK